MALKRRSRSQRFGNVANNYAEVPAASSSESSDGESEGIKKVRKRFSTKKLMKDSERYEVDYDHIYSAVGSREGNKKRKMTETSEEGNCKTVKTKCFSKNAIMARLNRERKKMYISTLENENDVLREQNSEMGKKIESQNKTINCMRREITYLKGLLANSKELGQILKSLQSTTDLPITSSLISNNKDTDFDKSVRTNNEESTEERKPIGRPYSLHKFPMIYEDINLGSTANKPLDYNESADSENLLVKNEQNSVFNLEDFEFNENTKFAWEEPLSWRDDSFYSNTYDPEFGICLHVNQKCISIEVCSICNGKANSCLNDHKNSEVLAT